MAFIPKHGKADRSCKSPNVLQQHVLLVLKCVEDHKQLASFLSSWAHFCLSCTEYFPDILDLSNRPRNSKQKQHKCTKGQDFLNYSKKKKRTESEQFVAMPLKLKWMNENLASCWRWWWAQHSGDIRALPSKLVLKGMLTAPLGAVWSTTKRQNASCLLSVKSYSDFYIVIYILYYV